jgi:thioredoxin 2
MLITCPHCSTKNRVDHERLSDGPTCGRCARELLAGAPIDVDMTNFDAVIHADRPVVVDFCARWCGPCRAFTPVFSAQAAQQTDVVFARVDTDANPELAQRYAIRSIPTLAVFVRGKLVRRLSGAQPAADFARWLKDAASPAARTA